MGEGFGWTLDIYRGESICWSSTSRKMQIMKLFSKWGMREVIPDCVLDTVRALYPNPKSIPYMGHDIT